MSKTKLRFLKPNATIGVVAPASPCEKEKTKKYCRMLADCGYNVILGKSALSKYGYLSGTDDVRAHDINSMFADDTVDAIFCLRGGYGCTRILERLDFECISANPKIFLGFSDITVLSNVFAQKCGFITFHGPSVSNCEWGTSDPRYTECMRILCGGEFELQSQYGYNSSRCVGEICGGNLTLTESLIGTEYEIDPTDKILILEDVGEKNYSIDRRLNHLKQAGYFKSCRAVLLGNFTQGDNDTKIENLPLRKIIEDIIVPCGKPVLCGMEFGHIPSNPTIPIGAAAYIENDVLNIDTCVTL